MDSVTFAAYVDEMIKIANSLVGGKGDNTPESALSREQLKKGIKVEMEHTKDPRIAREIATDHLTEIPDYYTRLHRMERNAGVND